MAGREEALPKLNYLNFILTGMGLQAALQHIDSLTGCYGLQQKSLFDSDQHAIEWRIKQKEE